MPGDDYEQLAAAYSRLVAAFSDLVAVGLF
jgi:hypothetical protein